MPYDLRIEPWLAVRRRSGAIDWVTPAALVDFTTTHPDDAIVALAGPRPDLNAAVTEFLIGLLTVALSPHDEGAWRQRWATPPAPAELQSALDSLPAAFDLDGDGPRVFQDLDPLADAQVVPIENLLIDAPGAQTARDNKDLFVKRARIMALGRPAAAMALIAMQTYAPSGGQGHRTSLRGGGPLTTLAEPRVTPLGEPLWRLLWANTEAGDQLEKRGDAPAPTWNDADRFPWLGPTRISDPKRQGRPTTPQDAAPDQAYFGLPRRIRLVIEPGTGPCDLTGRHDDARVTGFRMVNYGVEYDGWHHPLTPHYQDPLGAWLPLHGQAEGIGWRDWQGLLFGRPDGKRRPAQAVARFAGRRADAIGLFGYRLIAAGFDMDNMKARGWVQAELPAFAEPVVERLRAFVEPATAGADIAAGLLRTAVKTALFGAHDTRADFGEVKQDLWAATQAPFFDHVREIAERGAPVDGALATFRVAIRDAALAIFDRRCPLDGFEPARLRQPISARHYLAMALEGLGKSGGVFFRALGLASPRPRAGARRRSA